MPIVGPLINFINTFIHTQIINIPTDNALSVVYVILNIILQFIGALTGTGVTGS